MTDSVPKYPFSYSLFLSDTQAWARPLSASGLFVSLQRLVITLTEEPLGTVIDTDVHSRLQLPHT